MPSDPISNIKAFWEKRAKDPDLSEETVTHPDVNQRLLEIEVLLHYLSRGQRVLDVGCGNGFSTAVFAKYADSVVGIDCSAAMIRRAKRIFGDLPNLSFELQDVLSIDFPPKSFDVVISQRCLINMTSWKDQKKAIENISKVLKPGGCFFLQEGTQQGRERLNQAREMLGLDRMPTVEYNLDLDEEKLWPYLRNYFEVVEVRRFGNYDLISRIVHPLLVKPLEPQYDAKINEVARCVAGKLGGHDDLSREFFTSLRRLDR